MPQAELLAQSNPVVEIALAVSAFASELQKFADSPAAVSLAASQLLLQMEALLSPLQALVA